MFEEFHNKLKTKGLEIQKKKIWSINKEKAL